MRTMEEIYSALAGKLAADSGAVVVDGGDLSLRLRAVAAELFSLEAQGEFLARQSFPQTATGEYLDRHALLRGLTRGSARKAKGTLRFYLAETAAEAREIPAGTRCMTAPGTAFVTTERGSIAAGTLSCAVAAEADTAGSGGNAAPGSIVYMMHPPVGVSGVTNDTAFSGGSDGEGDEALRARILASYRTLPNGANAAYYESKVMDLDNVAAVSVLPRERGIGTVDVIFATHEGVPSADEIAAVQTMLDSEREICVDIAVRAPGTKQVAVSAALKIAETHDAAAVLAEAEAALRAWFSGALLGKAVYRAKLCALLMEVEGVENCTLTAPSGDVAAAVGVLPVCGTLTLEEAQ